MRALKDIEQESPRRKTSLITILGSAALLLGCSSSSGTGVSRDAGLGGSPGVGGSLNGGTNASSGGTGGSTSTSNGGAAGAATGGSSGTATGGSSGTATGGSSGTATGGSAGDGNGGETGVASGGSTGTDDAALTGGTVDTGGATAAGGSTGDGGATGTGVDAGTGGIYDGAGPGGSATGGVGAGGVDASIGADGVNSGGTGTGGVGTGGAVVTGSAWLLTDPSQEINGTGSCPLTVSSSATNVPGAVTPGGAAVTATDNGGTVTLSNGLVTIVITKASGEVDTITWNGVDMLQGGTSGGKLYWELQNGNGTYTLTADPKTNGGEYAEVRLHTTGTDLDVDIDYALLRGSNGFYATGILAHPAGHAAVNGGEWRSNIYIGTNFDWLSVDALRNKAMVSIADWGAAIAVAGAPKEVEQLTSGPFKGQYECKYSYSADFGQEDAWGFSSTTQNIGMWVTKPSGEYYNGGPKKRELTSQAGNALLNMLGGAHYLQGVSDETIASATDLTKIYGPFFYYFNKVSTGTACAPSTLFADAIAQAKAEQKAWPYTWFKNTTVGNYAQESGRGTVTGTFAIADPGAPNASPAGMWIGLAPDTGDFQGQFFTYQFWVRTGVGGAFTIPHVLPGTYALYAFGPGGAGTFKQTNVTVTAGQTLALGKVAWTPPRTAATVWEIGVPDRDSHEFLNGAFNYTQWQTAEIDFPTTFGNGVTYTVGADDYSKVWDYEMLGAGTWTVKFNMASAPTVAQGRFYLALAASTGSTLNVSVNGTSIGTITPGNTSDAVVRLGSHGAFWDTSVMFNSNLLKAGANTLTIDQSGGGATLEWDYLRLEAN